jgi:DNA-nicking Smr family endonuclease
MTRRIASAEERALFEEVFKNTRPLKRPAAKRSAAKATKKNAAPMQAGLAIKPVRPSGIDGNTERDLRKGDMAPDARLDLHGLTESAAHRALATFLRGAQMRGARLLLIVTGKGARGDDTEPFDMGRPKRGVLKTMTPRWLKESEFAPLIADVRSAHRRHGGEGALYVYLRKRP